MTWFEFDLGLLIWSIYGLIQWAPENNYLAVIFCEMYSILITFSPSSIYLLPGLIDETLWLDSFDQIC